MLVIIDAERAIDRHLRGCLPKDAVVVMRTWSGVDSSTRVRAYACMYVCPELADAAVQEIRRIQRESAFLPIILVTSGTKTNVSRLKDVRVTEIVWLEAAADDLLPVLKKVRASASVAERFAQELESNPRMAHPTIQPALLAMLRSGEPLPTRIEMGRQAAYAPSSLSVKLGDLIGPVPRAVTKLKYAIRTLRAYDLAVYGHHKEEYAAAVLGVDTTTLRRAIHSVTGGAFNQLRRLPPDQVLRLALNAIGLSTADVEQTATNHGAPAAEDG
jgi:hypothetical protein